jgi:signal peptidase I
LLIALALTGIIWLADVWQARQRRLAGAPHVPPSQFVAQVRSAFPVLLFVVVFRSFVLEPYRIPSASMMPNLIAGDFIVVSKFAYGLRMPVLNTKLIPIGEPRRGDVVVFWSSTERIDLIKRLIGLPGDHVVVRDNRIWINGHLVPLEAAGTFTGDDAFDGAELDRELLDSREHTVMLAPGLRSTDFEGTVPAHRYFFMGDNRNDSADSRFPQVGFVPEENLVGPALVIWMSWRFPGWPMWDRIGQRIR